MKPHSTIRSIGYLSAFTLTLAVVATYLERIGKLEDSFIWIFFLFIGCLAANVYAAFIKMDKRIDELQVMNDKLQDQLDQPLLKDQKK